MSPAFIDKAAVLAVRIVRNHPLPDGNKRLAWSCLTMFCVLNGHDLDASVEDTVHQVFAAAAGEVDEEAMAVAVRKWSERRRWRARRRLGWRAGR